MGSPRIETPPMIVIKIAMTIATMGLLMKNFDMARYFVSVGLVVAVG